MSKAGFFKQVKSKLVVEQDVLKELREMENFEEIKKMEFEVGIDEAGRGPVMGPMVYGGMAWPIKMKDKLAKLGFQDSKKLDEESRESLFEFLKEFDGKLLFKKEVVCDPLDISSRQLCWDKEGLNTYSHNCAISIIRYYLSLGLNVRAAYLDTVGDPGKYRYLLENTFAYVQPPIAFTVTSKADDLFSVVSAASIAAKVTRDRTLKDVVVKEGVQMSREFGSGYPSDPNTVKWLSDHFDNFFGYPSIVRFSWSTITKRLEEAKLEYEFLRHSGGLTPGASIMKETFSQPTKPAAHIGNLMHKTCYKPNFDL